MSLIDVLCQQSQITENQMKWQQLLYAEKSRGDLLEERVNDLAEQHQQEIVSVKMVVFMTFVSCLLTLVQEPRG